MLFGHLYFFHILCPFFFWIGCFFLHLFEPWFPHLESEAGRRTISKTPSTSAGYSPGLDVLQAAFTLLPEVPGLLVTLLSRCWAAGPVAAGELQEARFLLLFSCVSSSLKKAGLEITGQSWDWTSIKAACRHQEYLFSLFVLSLGRLCGFLNTVLMEPWPASVQCP